MRRFFLALAIAAFSFQSVGEAFAQHHACRCHDCVQKGSVQKGGAPESAPRPEDAPRPEAGAYVGPPRTGTQVGESNSFGIEGLSIKFPELNLKLPELNFPHLTHRRKGPSMEVEAAKAPYVPQVDRAEYGVETEAAPRPEPSSPEDALRPEDPVQAPKFDTPLQHPTQKSTHYQHQGGETESSHAVLEQIRRFEERERELTSQLAQMQQLMQRFTESSGARGGEEVPDRHIGNSLNSSQRRQPQPLPAVSMTRPASFDAPIGPIQRVPVPERDFTAARNERLEAEIAELRRLVFDLHQQREVLQQSNSRSYSNTVQMTRIVAPDQTRQASTTPMWTSQPRRLPPVVR